MGNNRSSKVLSKKDINKLREAYNNKNISDKYLTFEVTNLMKCEEISKEQAISNILRIVSN